MFDGAVGNDAIENAMWQLCVVWIKGKNKIRHAGEEAVSITHKSRGSREEFLKTELS